MIDIWGRFFFAWSRLLAQFIPWFAGIWVASSAWATTYEGRVMTGAYVSKESFSEASDGTGENDYFTFSNRLYFRASEINSTQAEAVVDLRDKDDLFGQLNQQQLILTPENTLQVYQLSAKLPGNPGSLYGQVGRFPVDGAGAVFTDGAETGYRWNADWRTSIFGGLDPRLPDQLYVTYNPGATVAGTYTTYQPKFANWNQNTYWTDAFVAENFQGHLDRLYWFNNFVYQWDAPNQLIVLAYLDFVPNVYIQTGLLSYHQQLPERWTTTLNLSAITALEYQRRESVLSVIPPSNYREASANFRRDLNGRSFFDTNFAYGLRDADGLSRFEVSAGPSAYKLINEHFAASSLVGFRKNFTTHDSFTRLTGGYYTRDWEFDVSVDYALSQEIGANTYHQWTEELSVARNISRELYASVMGQRAEDERVGIWSAFFKIGYRFGSTGVPPLRDGAPPPGRL